MIQELRRVVRGESFDEQPMPDLDSEALGFRAASESFASVRRFTRHPLATLHLTANHQGRRVPTVGGMLLFGLDRSAHFPDAWIQAGRFAGVDKTRIADHAELRDLPVRAIEQAIQFIEKHSTHGVTIGRVFHALGLIEQWGSGVQRMIAACREAGLAPPRFEEIATRLRVAIYTERVSHPSVETTDQTILDALSDGEGRLTSEIAALIGLTSRATRTRLARLVESGLLREVGTGPQDPKRRYFRVQ